VGVLSLMWLDLAMEVPQIARRRYVPRRGLMGGLRAVPLARPPWRRVKWLGQTRTFASLLFSFVCIARPTRRPTSDCFPCQQPNSTTPPRTKPQHPPSPVLPQQSHDQRQPCRRHQRDQHGARRRPGGPLAARSSPAAPRRAPQTAQRGRPVRPGRRSLPPARCSTSPRRPLLAPTGPRPPCAI
jgi:hypothetical protein